MGKAMLLHRGGGGEYGDAVASDVLDGKTVGTDNGLIVGTMPDNGTVNLTLSNNNAVYTIPTGYHSGDGKVTATITNLVAGNVKHNIAVGGVAGSFSGDADAAAGDLLSNKKAYGKGNLITGTMVNRGSPTFTTGAEQAIPAGYYSGGKVLAAADGGFCKAGAGSYGIPSGTSYDMGA